MKSWSDLKKHLEHWYHKPDLQALDVALTVACSHYITESDPIWLFVIGTSRSGKSSIIINGLSALPNTHVISDLTPRTLVSGMVVAAGAPSPSLLNRIGPSGILLFKDFTTFLSKRHDDQIEIASQLREIHDGQYVRKTGSGIQTEWQGKLGIIAACTGAVERAWSTQRELGERFVQVRWPRVGGSEFAKSAGRQVGQENEIKKITRDLCAAYCDSRKALAPMCPNGENYLSYLAELTACARGQVVRDSYGDRKVLDMCQAEEPSSLFKTFSIIVRTHAAMWDREVMHQDLMLAKRVAHDCVSSFRRRILDQLPRDGSPVARSVLSSRFHLSDSTIQYHADELAAHGLLDSNKEALSELHSYKYSEETLLMLEEMDFSLTQLLHPLPVSD
jgi:DNA-binding transcriptional ArsR family regulator